VGAETVRGRPPGCRAAHDQRDGASSRVNVIALGAARLAAGAAMIRAVEADIRRVMQSGRRGRGLRVTINPAAPAGVENHALTHRPWSSCSGGGQRRCRPPGGNGTMIEPPARKTSAPAPAAAGRGRRSPLRSESAP